MSRCTAPVNGHRTASGREACPACGSLSRNYNWLLCQESGHKSTNKFDFQFKLLNLIFGGRSFSPVQILKTL